MQYADAHFLLLLIQKEKSAIIEKIALPIML